jgi:Kef-type K+ transport system membrane component KefB
MKKILLFSLLLLAGLVLSQLVPLLPSGPAAVVREVVQLLAMVALGFIMIHVGYEFEIEKDRLRGYGWDAAVAMTAAAGPWLLVALYFMLVLFPAGSVASFGAWKETLLAGLFAAPTSAGVLFSMLAAAGLGATWLFGKARVLAIFDDLGTVLLIIPLKMLMIGPAWQLGAVVVLMGLMLWAAWRWLHRVPWPVAWPWVLGSSAAIVAASEVLYLASKAVDADVPIHIEVLLPAFVLGCMIRRPAGADPHRDDAREGHQEGPESPAEQRVSTLVSAAFMVLVGMSMPPLFTGAAAATGAAASSISAALSSPGWGIIALHVLLITAVSNLGKMFPALCYRREAGRRERLALAVGMWPRGEVGAGVLMVSLGFGLGGPMITIAVLSLALNLALTGIFVWFVKRLLA